MTDAKEGEPEGLAVRLATHRAPALREVVVGLDEEAHGMLGEVQVAAVPLAGVPAEYRAEARLEAGAENLTRGWVTKADPDGDEVAIEVRNSTPLTETLIGHLSIAGIDHNEVAWSMSRWMGMAAVVPGLRPFPETIAVAMPLTGLEVSSEIDLEPIRVSADRQVLEIMAAPLNDTSEKEAFLAAGAWAIVRFEAYVLAVAEEAAVPLIEAAIDRLALEAQYSLATDPAGVALPFARPALLTDPAAGRTVLVHGHLSGRTWLRSLDNPPVRSRATVRRLVLPVVPDNPAWTDALRAWRRAVRETDPLAAVGALFEAVEFYTSGTTVPQILSPSDLRGVARAVDAMSLAPEKRQRLADVLARANEPPLRVRLVAALKADGVPHSAEEIKRLWRLRDHRNDALHGRGRAMPDPDDLDLAKGLVNRMLIFRAWRGVTRR
jgi:hypothetical protein